jgi:biotin carboxyl carrier protein
MKKLRVTIDGKVYEVLVEILDQGSASPTAFATAPSSSAASVPAAPSVAAAPKVSPVPSGNGAVVSPLAGKIVSLDVKVGQSVKEGTQLATIEAMKMNTFVYAAQAGTISVVHVSPGDAVEEGAALLTIV